MDVFDRPLDPPDQPSDVPDQSSDLSDQPADAPDQPSDLSDQPADAPDQPSDLSDQPADTPDQLLDASDRLSDTLGSRFIERKEVIPTDPEPGNYVVVDVMFFSTTVVELLRMGAAFVHVTRERGMELDYKAENPGARIGGSNIESYDPVDGFDFYNSPSYVQSLDVQDRPIYMTSTNGGWAVDYLRTTGGEGVEIYVGSTTNAAALGRLLRRDDAPAYLVSAGSKGEYAVEDHVGAVLIGRYLEGIPPADLELEIYRDLLTVAKGPHYVDNNEVRRRDVIEFASAVNSRSVVPKLVGDRLVDVIRTDTVGRALDAPTDDSETTERTGALGSSG